MTSLVQPRATAPVPFLSVLLSRHRALTLFGLTCLGLAAAAAALQAMDGRTLASGISVWTKPAKFYASVAIFALTTAWYFGHVRPERRRSRAMRITASTIIVAGTLELAWITWQGAQGLESHFNDDTIFFAVMYALMGVFALILTATTLPLAWEIARRPARQLTPHFQAALIAGLVLTFVLGAGFGIAISVNGAHAVGSEAGSLPPFGWNRVGGDLRIAHFVGIHAQQAIPLLAVAVQPLDPSRRRVFLTVGIVLYVAVTLALYNQAAAGLPLFPL